MHHHFFSDLKRQGGMNMSRTSAEVATKAWFELKDK